MNDDQLQLIADSHHGQYIPQLVTKGELKNEKWNWSEVSQEDIDCLLKGPEDNEWYWDAWNNAISNIIITHDGYTWRLVENEDLWAVRDDVHSDELDKWYI